MIKAVVYMDKDKGEIGIETQGSDVELMGLAKYLCLTLERKMCLQIEEAVQERKK